MLDASISEFTPRRRDVVIRYYWGVQNNYRNSREHGG